MSYGIKSAIPMDPLTYFAGKKFDERSDMQPVFHTIRSEYAFTQTQHERVDGELTTGFGLCQ